MNITELDVTSVQPHPANVRHDLGDLTELADSITGQGILQPLTVAPQGDSHVIIAGHRRHAAAIKAGLPTVPAIIRDDLDTPIKQLEAMLTENLQRADLTITEEADAYQQLELLGVKPADIAKATGRSKATVQARLRIAALPDAQKALIDDGQLNLDTAIEFATHLDDPEIRAILDKGEHPANTRWNIRQVLLERERANDPEPEPEPAPQSTPKRATSDDWEAKRAAAAARNELINASIDSVHQWALRQMELNDPDFHDRLATYALAYQIIDSGGSLEAFGIDGPNPDEDEAAWREDTVATISKWPTPKKLTAIAWWSASLDDLPPWMYEQQLPLIIDILGYEPSDAEKALLNPQ